MEYLLHFFLGLLVAYIGLLAPGMLNMTAVQITVDKKSSYAYKFAVGASIIIMFQAGIALFFAGYLNKNPDVITLLEKIGVFVFFALSILFFLKTRSKLKYKKKKRKGNYFLNGAIMSMANMLSIPFFLASSTYLVAIGFLLMRPKYIILFVVGAMFGAYLLFFTYIAFAKVIIKRANFIARNINYILSVLFLVLGIWTWLK